MIDHVSRTNTIPSPNHAFFSCRLCLLTQVLKVGVFSAKGGKENKWHSNDSAMWYNTSTLRKTCNDVAEHVGSFNCLRCVAQDTAYISQNLRLCEIYALSRLRQCVKAASFSFWGHGVQSCFCNFNATGNMQVDTAVEMA